MLAFSGANNFAFAQTVIKGKVTDASSAEAIPFANIFFKGTSVGVQTDFDGYFELKSANPKDSIVCDYFGYKRKTKAIVIGQAQTINFQISAEGVEMAEVVIYARENPALRIIRNAVASKTNNDKRSLKAYEYESYNKIELDVDQISNKLKKRKAFRQIAQLMDSLQKIAGEDGKPILPLFISESYSKVYKTNAPERTREEIEATKVTGVGMTDGSVLSQLVGSTFQEYNFYKDYLNILNKDIVSPISANWKTYYDYYLIDSSFVGDNWCYRIDFVPKNEYDLALTGSVWITDSSWAIKRINASIDKRANINFIDKVKIQQDNYQTPAGPWLPLYNRVLVDIAQLADSAAGMLGKFYSANKNFYINRPRDASFYEEQLSVKDDAGDYKEEFWTAHRPENLSEAEKNVFKMVDTLRNLPVVKTYVEIVETALSGFYNIGKIDIGPYAGIYARNSLEGGRFRLGFRTSDSFSKHYSLWGYGAYGTLDDKFKYGVGGKVIVNRKRWTEVGLYHIHDIGQLAYSIESIVRNPLLEAFSRWSFYRRAYYTHYSAFYFSREFKSGFSGGVSVTRQTFDPLFNFGVYNDVEAGEAGGISRTFVNTEVSFQARFAFKELFIVNGTTRISLGAKKYPIFTAKLSVAEKGMLGGNFTYQKLQLIMNQSVRMGIWGRGTYELTGGAFLLPAPYPLLNVHIGNQSYFNNGQAFNTMNYFEFISDRWLSLKYFHQFDGILFNRIPLLKRLKIREIAGANVLWGYASPENMKYIPQAYQTVDGKAAYHTLSNDPFAEAYYGVDNIFKFMRISFFHRLTYRDPADYSVNRFAVKVSAHFSL